MTEPIDFPEDVQRIKRILEQRNVFITDEQIDDAWTAYSESVMAGWIAPPSDDEVVAKMIWPHLP